MVWYSHLFQNFPQFIVIHTVKGFFIVNKAEIDIFLKLSCFFDDPAELKSVSKLGKIFLPFLLLNPINLMSSRIIYLCLIFEVFPLKFPYFCSHHEILLQS